MKSYNFQVLKSQNPSLPSNTTSLQIRCLQLAAIVGLVSFALCTAVSAVDFSGSLKEISISDGAGTNKPPTAVFTYSQNGKILSFDASNSFDTDGSITQYKWEFGDGTTSEGRTASYTFTNTANLQVTLTVVDNNYGVALKQQIIVPATDGIIDDFSSDTTNNYINLTGVLTVSGAAAHGKVWARTIAYHKSDLGNNDHWVEADVFYDGTRYCAGVAARIDTASKTGYYTYFSNGSVILASFSGTGQTWIASSAGNFTLNTYKIRLETNSNIIKVFVNGALIISKADATITNGTHTGLFFTEGPDNPLVKGDNFKAGVF